MIGETPVSLRTLGFATVLLLSCLAFPTLLMAQQDTQSSPTHLVLEVTFFRGQKPAYQSVPPGNSSVGSWYGMYGVIDSWQFPPGMSKTRAVRIVPYLEREGVRVVVTVLSGDKGWDREDPVATYLVHQNEKINTEELRQSGIEPFGIKLMRVAPSLTEVPPVVLKGVTSLTLVNAIAIDQTLPSYKVTLLNASGKNIVGLAFAAMGGDKTELSGMRQDRFGQPLVPSGKDYVLTLQTLLRARETQTGLEPAPIPNLSIVIKTVAFDDGTYE